MSGTFITRWRRAAGSRPPISDARHDALRAEQRIPSFKRVMTESAETLALHPDHRKGIRDLLVQFLIK
jgi:hypothetical protein